MTCILVRRRKSKLATESDGFNDIVLWCLTSRNRCLQKSVKTSETPDSSPPAVPTQDHSQERDSTSAVGRTIHKCTPRPLTSLSLTQEITEKNISMIKIVLPGREYWGLDYWRVPDVKIYDSVTSYPEVVSLNLLPPLPVLNRV